MKYYAVTDDPRELYHYGVKGMKWGQHIFGDKPKSPGYHKAAKKLKAIASKTASGAKTVGKAVQKTAAQISYNNRARQERKYNKAVQKAQQRIRLTDALSSLDKEDKFRKQVDRDRKIENLRQKQADIQSRNDLKTLQKAVKYEKKMPKYYQEAREGTLKYGKLTDDQVARLQNRLALEANTRRLGSTEEPSWRQQKKMARRQGYLQGITRGTAAAMEEVARAGTQYGIQNLMNRKKLDAASEQRAKREKKANQIRNQKSHKEIRDEIKQEAYEMQVREGEGPLKRHAHTTAGAAKKIQNLTDAKNERIRSQKLQERLANERDENYSRKLLESGMTEEEARKDLAKKVQAKYGLDSREFKEVAKINTSKDKDAQRRLMAKYNEEFAKDKQKEAFNKFNDYLKEKQKLDDEFDKKWDKYQRDLNDYNNGKISDKPKKPKRKNPDPLDYDTYNTLIKISNMPNPYTYNPNGGGGKKKK